MSPKKEAERENDVSQFVKQVWFILMFFALMLMIASFGLIAET